MQVVRFGYAIFIYNEEDEMVQVLDAYDTLQEAEEDLLDKYPMMTEAFVGTITYARLYPAERVQLSEPIVRDELPTF